MFCKFKFVNRLNPPNEFGMGPVNPMVLSVRLCRLVRAPMTVGILAALVQELP